MIELFILLKSDGMERSLHMLLQSEAFLWLMLDTHIISTSQVPTHAKLDLDLVIKETKKVHQNLALTTTACLMLHYIYEHYHVEI